MMIELLDDLFAYSDWANAKVIRLCDGLTDQQLDEPREIGFGSLRATLFHILAADQMWMERWQGMPWREFPRDPEGMPVAEIEQQLCRVAQDRCELLTRKRAVLWEEQIQYQDSGKTPYDHRLADLMLHVFNHGTHHRAQALAYLKRFDRTTPMGIDYIFYRTEVGTSPQSPEAAAMLAGFEMNVGSTPGDQVHWDAKLVQRWFEYHDWANERVLAFAKDLSKQQREHDFGMGPTGTILGTLQHLFDVENWWFDTMIRGENCFGSPSGIETIDNFQEAWKELASRRNEYLRGLNSESLGTPVRFHFGGPELQYTVVESVTQTLNHGVHHRAQLINMLRHSQAPIANIDLLYAIDQLV